MKDVGGQNTCFRGCRGSEWACTDWTSYGTGQSKLHVFVLTCTQVAGGRQVRRTRVSWLRASLVGPTFCWWFGPVGVHATTVGVRFFWWA